VNERTPAIAFEVDTIQLEHVEVLADGISVSEVAPGGRITVTRRGGRWRVEGTSRFTARSARRVLFYLDKLQREATRFAAEAQVIAAERGKGT